MLTDARRRTSSPAAAHRAPSSLLRDFFSAPQLVLCVLLFAFVRLRFFTTNDLYLDEIFTLRAVRLGWGEMLAFVAADIVHPPLFYLLLKLWRAVGGESLAWLRLLPCLTAIATVPLFLLLCRELRVARTTRNLALLLMAVNSYLIINTLELRMYALLQLLSVCSLWLFARYYNIAPRDADPTHSRPGRDAPALVWLTVVNLLLVYTHYYGWAVVGIEFLTILVGKRRKLFAFILSGICLAGCFGVWVYAVVANRTGATDLGRNLVSHVAPSVRDAAWFFAQLNGGFFRRSTSLGLLLFLAPVAVALWRRRRRASETSAGDSKLTVGDGRILWWLATLVLLPVVLAFAASHLLPHGVWQERYFVFTVAPYALLVSICVAELRPRALRVAWMLVIIVWAVASGFVGLKSSERLAWGDVAKQITKSDTQIAESDAASDMATTPTDVYAFTSNVAYNLEFQLDEIAPSRFRVTVVSDDRVRAQTRTVHQNERDLPAATFESVAANGVARFWLVARDVSEGDGELLRSALAARGYVSEKMFADVTPSDRVTAYLVRRR